MGGASSGSDPRPKATSVDRDGRPDEFVPEPGWLSEMTPSGDTRIVVSVPPAELQRVHAALIGALRPPLGVLYRQKVDRASPRPQGAPPRDWVALDKPPQVVVDAVAEASGLVFGDARHELWIRGALGEQLVLDQDGLLFCYPDDPSFRDALSTAAVPPNDVVTMSDRDYVKHWFHAENDALETALLTRLRMTEVPHHG